MLWRPAGGELGQQPDEGLVDKVLRRCPIAGVGSEMAAQRVSVIRIRGGGEDGQAGDRLPPNTRRVAVAARFPPGHPHVTGAYD